MTNQPGQTQQAQKIILTGSSTPMTTHAMKLNPDKPEKIVRIISNETHQPDSSDNPNVSRFFYNHKNPPTDALMSALTEGSQRPHIIHDASGLNLQPKNNRPGKEEIGAWAGILSILSDKKLYLGPEPILTVICDPTTQPEIVRFLYLALYGMEEAAFEANRNMVLRLIWRPSLISQMIPHPEQTKTSILFTGDTRSKRWADAKNIKTDKYRKKLTRTFPELGKDFYPLNCLLPVLTEIDTIIHARLTAKIRGR